MMDSVFSFRCRHCAAKLRLRNYLPGDEIPACPQCGEEPIEMVNKLDLAGPPPAHIGSPKARAEEETYKAMETQYGITDMRDNLREGDIAAPKLTPMQERMKAGWDANRGVTTQGGLALPPPAQLLQGARANNASHGIDTFQKLGKSGKLPHPKQMTQIIGRQP